MSQGGAQADVLVLKAGQALGLSHPFIFRAALAVQTLRISPRKLCSRTIFSEAVIRRSNKSSRIGDKQLYQYRPWLQRVGNGNQEQESVPSLSIANVRRSQAESERNVLGVAEGFFYRKAARVRAYDARGRKIMPEVEIWPRLLP